MSKSESDFYIEIKDENSGVKVAEVKMNADQFAHAMTGMWNVDCEWEFMPIQKVSLLATEQRQKRC